MTHDIPDNNKPVDKNIGTFLDAEKIRQELNALPIHVPNTTDDDIKGKKNLSNSQEAAKGMAASMSIVSGVMVGGLLGYGFDCLFNTLPFATVIMIPIGMIAGFRNMIRSLDSDKNHKPKETK
jgi:F0F1-type ATP synthase assembly protein I